MKRAQIVSIYVIALVFSIGYKMFQLLNMIDPQTGFYHTEYKNANTGIFLVSTVLVLALVLLGSFLEDQPKFTLKSSKAVGVLSFLLSIPAVIMAVQVVLSSQDNRFQSVSGIFTILFAAFMSYYGYCLFFNKPINMSACLAPVLFAGVRLASEFVKYFGLPRTAEIIMYILMLLSSFIFWHCFGRFVAGVNLKVTIKWMIGFGLLASLFCFTNTLPVLYIEAFKSGTEYRTITDYLYFDVMQGVYILIFLFFAYKNRGEDAENGTI